MFRIQPAFPGGITLPPVERSSRDAQVRQIGFAPLLRLPLRQHGGAAAVAVVKAGEEVMRGQLLARADDATAVPLHAPATGRVQRFTVQADGSGGASGTVQVIELAPLAGDTQEDLRTRVVDPERCSADELLSAIRNTGLVGQGEEAGATHWRLQQARERGARLLVVNGIELEPGFCTVPALLVQHAADVLRGVAILSKVLGLQQAVLAVEEHDTRAAQALLKSVPAGLGLVLKVLPPRYPQGAAELLLRVLAGSPLDGGLRCTPAQSVVFSLATVAEVGRLLGSGRVMTERLVCLVGDAMREPGNVRVPLGTPLAFALAEAGLQAEPDQVLDGGPMRGRALADLDRPILKHAAGFVASTAASSPPVSAALPCIRCGECVAACPLQLHPAEMGLRARRGEVPALVSDWQLQRCNGCGCCSYVCPSHIPLAQMFRAAQGQWQRSQARA